VKKLALVIGWLAVSAAFNAVQAVSVVGCLENAAGLPDNAKLTFTPVISSGLLQDGTNIVTTTPIVVVPSGGCFTQAFVPANYWLTSDALSVSTWFTVPTNAGPIDWRTCMTNTLSYVPVTNSYVLYYITTNTGAISYTTNLSNFYTINTSVVTQVIYTNGGGGNVSGNSVYTNLVVGQAYQVTNACMVYSTFFLSVGSLNNYAEAGVWTYKPNLSEIATNKVRIDAKSSVGETKTLMLSASVVSNGWFKFFTNGSGGASTKATNIYGSGYIFYLSQ
jgi:hypothetical protein